MLKKHGFFDKQVIEENKRKYFNGDDSVNFKIWALIVFQGWYENYYSNLKTNE